MSGTDTLEISHSYNENIRNFPNDSSSLEVRTYSILLVEDSKSDVLMVKKALGQGFALIDVPRIRDALSMLNRMPYDLILLDLNLLDMSGIAAVTAIHAAAARIPIIVLTGTNEMGTKQAALLCGAKRYWIKGNQSAHLLKDMVRQLLLASQSHT